MYFISHHKLQMKRGLHKYLGVVTWRGSIGGTYWKYYFISSTTSSSSTQHSAPFLSSLLFPHTQHTQISQLRSLSASINFTMVTLFDSLAVVRLPTAAFSPAATSRTSVLLPHCAGLRLRPAAATRLVASPARRIASRAARVVCEAQDTAVEGQLPFFSSLLIFYFYSWKYNYKKRFFVFSTDSMHVNQRSLVVDSWVS